MARFYGSMQGARGATTRCGTAGSGIHAHTRGWDIGINVEAVAFGPWDTVVASLTGGSTGSISSEEVFRAYELVDDQGEKTGEKRVVFSLPEIGKVAYKVKTDGTWVRDGWLD